MKIGWKLAVLLMLCSFSLVLGVVYIADTPLAAQAYASDACFPTIVIDPGHGGFDGGAVGINGVIEKDINLSLSLDLAEMFRVVGYQVVMTRTDDRSIHDQSVEGIKKQKTSDMHNRLAIMQQYPNGIVLSIHQNQFSQSKYSGGQLFYGIQKEENSRLLAETMQNNLKDFLQPENNRQIKQAYDNLYLMKNAPSTAVLVECGFLSNPDEAELLSQEEYRRKVAFVICSSTLQFIQEEMIHGNQI
ncbi:MAG: N-acetylmuramoyl-L-alanine amidase [Oscillospiraceae bacterium]|nr:N-acetylmuramoyl-L-alanine amidase [Oscillospiraceae bacterium]